MQEEVNMPSYEQRIQRLEEATAYRRPLTDVERVVRIAAIKKGTPTYVAVWTLVLRQSGR